MIKTLLGIGRTEGSGDEDASPVHNAQDENAILNFTNGGGNMITPRRKVPPPHARDPNELRMTQYYAPDHHREDDSTVLLSDSSPSPATHRLTLFANANKPASEERKDGEEEVLQEEPHEAMGNNNEGPTDPVGPPPVTNPVGPPPVANPYVAQTVPLSAELMARRVVQLKGQRQLLEVIDLLFRKPQTSYKKQVASNNRSARVRKVAREH